MPELVPKNVVTAFKECFVSRETLRTIEDFFTDLGEFDQAASDSESLRGHGQRRSKAAGYLDVLDLGSPRDADALIRAIEFKLSEWEKTGDPKYRSDLDRLIRVKKVARINWDGEHLSPQLPPAHFEAQSSRLRPMGLADVDIELARIDSAIGSDPADAITAARSLVESVCKAVLEDLGVPYSDSEDLAALSRKTAKALRLDPVAHDLIYRQILQGLMNAVHGLAELRNARLAAGAALTVSLFLLEARDRVKAERTS